MNNRLLMLRTALGNLDKVVFPRLIRPNVPRGAPPTRGLIDWDIRFYCFSLLSHYREILRSTLWLIRRGRIPAAFVLSRCLFEMGAHAHYVHKHVCQHLKSGDLKLTWEFLTDINMGSRYIREEDAECGQGSEEAAFPLPRDVAKVIRCMNELVMKGKDGAVKTYSYLSEFSHPNMAAFSNYYKFRQDKHGMAVLDFIEPTSDPSAAPLPETSISLVSVLTFTQKLLAQTGEQDIATRINEIRDRVFKMGEQNK